MLKSRLLFKKKANLTGKLLQNCKYLECENFRIILKHANLDDCAFNKYGQRRSIMTTKNYKKL